MLVVTCLRQVVAERAEEGPAMISVRSKQQGASLKKTAEEKAFAMYGRVAVAHHVRAHLYITMSMCVCWAAG